MLANFVPSLIKLMVSIIHSFPGAYWRHPTYLLRVLIFSIAFLSGASFALSLTFTLTRVNGVGHKNVKFMPKVVVN